MSYEIRNDKLLREAYEAGRRQALNEQNLPSTITGHDVGALSNRRSRHDITPSADTPIVAKRPPKPKPPAGGIEGYNGNWYYVGRKWHWVWKDPEDVPGSTPPV